MKKIPFLLFLLFPQLAFAACETGYFPTVETSTSRKFIVCDTAAEIPSSGWTQGDLTYAKDTEVLKVADSTTTVQAPSYESPPYFSLPNSATPPTTDCDAAGEAGRIYYDTDATSQKRIYACEGVTGWKLQGDGDSGGAPAWGTITGTLSSQTIPQLTG